MKVAAMFVVLALAGCSGTPSPYSWDSTRKKEEFPFRDWVHGLKGYGLQEQVEAVEEEASRLPETPSVKGGPSWSELLDELFLQRRADLLYALLDGRQMPAGPYEALGAELSAREDEQALELLEEFLAMNRMTKLRPSVVWIVGNYARYPRFAKRVTPRLSPIALDDPDPKTRAYAVRGLGLAGNPDSIPVLLLALQDQKPVKGQETVSTFAEQALKEIEQKTGKPIPRKPAGK